MTAGVDGTISTLDTYDDGTPHRGLNAIDIAAPGGSAVSYQVGELPPEIAGGWLWIETVQEKGYCSQYAPDSPYYNGGKIQVTAFFYNSVGDYLGWHRAAFQHVLPSREQGTWLRWNNVAAERPAWPVVDATLGNGPEGAVWLGSVFGAEKPIYNGDSGGLCWDGAHLHQEAQGERASLELRQEAVAGRTPMHVFDIQYSGTPVDLPAAPCGEVDHAGLCDGGVLYACREDGSLMSVDCASVGLACVWTDLGDSSGGFYSCF